MFPIITEELLVIILLIFNIVSIKDNKFKLTDYGKQKVKERLNGNKKFMMT